MRKKIGLIIILAFIAFCAYGVFMLFAPVFHTASTVIMHPFAKLQEDGTGRTNVLLLGIGGGTHDGPDLTDTIMLASINWKKNTVTLVSIPRDLWIPSIPGNLKKANEAYALGGLSQATAMGEEVTGQKIQYAVRLDFQGFVDAIDSVGGVDVTVARQLDDYNYPISGMEDDACGHTPQDIQAFTATASADTDTFTFFPCRFKHLHFDVGQQHMDGQTALEFARSRHGVGIEGSDFARSARQQLIIEAVRNKLISSAFLNPSKLSDLYNIMKNSIDTDISQQDVGLFLEKTLFFKNATINSAVIDYGDYTTGRPGLLMNAPVTAEYDFAAALIPRIGNGDFSEIHRYVVCELTKGDCAVTPTPTTTIIPQK